MAKRRNTIRERRETRSRRSQRGEVSLIHLSRQSEPDAASQCPATARRRRTAAPPAALASRQPFRRSLDASDRPRFEPHRRAAGRGRPLGRSRPTDASRADGGLRGRLLLGGGGGLRAPSGRQVCDGRLRRGDDGRAVVRGCELGKHGTRRVGPGRLRSGADHLRTAPGGVLHGGARPHRAQPAGPRRRGPSIVPSCFMRTTPRNRRWKPTWRSSERRRRSPVP